MIGIQNDWSFELRLRSQKQLFFKGVVESRVQAKVILRDAGNSNSNFFKWHRKPVIGLWDKGALIYR